MWKRLKNIFAKNNSSKRSSKYPVNFVECKLIPSHELCQASIYSGRVLTKVLNGVKIYNTEIHLMIVKPQRNNIVEPTYINGQFMVPGLEIIKDSLLPELIVEPPKGLLCEMIGELGGPVIYPNYLKLEKNSEKDAMFQVWTVYIEDSVKYKKSDGSVEQYYYSNRAVAERVAQEIKEKIQG